MEGVFSEFPFDHFSFHKFLPLIYFECIFQLSLVNEQDTGYNFPYVRLLSTLDICYVRLFSTLNTDPVTHISKIQQSVQLKIPNCYSKQYHNLFNGTCNRKIYGPREKRLIKD